MTAYFLNKQVFYGPNLPYVSLLPFQAGPRPSTPCFPRGSALRVRLVTGLFPGDREAGTHSLTSVSAGLEPVQTWSLRNRGADHYNNSY